MAFSADQLVESGLVELQGGVAQGSSAHMHLRGEVHSFGPFVNGIVIVTLLPGAVRRQPLHSETNSAGHSVFALSVEGLWSKDEFILRGNGPHGLAVEIVCHRRGTIASFEPNAGLQVH